MAILIKKPLTVPALKPAPPVEEGLSILAPLIDEYGKQALEAAKIAARIKKLQEELKPFNDAKKALEAALVDFDAGDDAELDEKGEKFRLEAGKRGTSRSIADLPKIKELMGDELFMQVATVTLKDIDAYLTQPQRDTVLDTERTTRSWKVIARPVKK